MSTRGPKTLRAATLSALLTILVSLAGCGGGAGSGSDSSGLESACDSASPSADSCGQLIVGLTDAEGDFVNYEVEVRALSLKRANGSTVEILPNATRLDFAQASDVTDIVSAALIPPGVYVSGSVELDFSTADVHVEGPGGEIVPGQIVDSNGNPLGITTLDIQLADQNVLAINRRQALLLSVDFDLAASNTVDTSTNPARITAEPYIVAEVTPVDEKELRVRGALAGVDVAASTYSIQVRPWHHHQGEHGALTVYTTESTTFEIGDQILTGGAGLRALENAGAGTLTVAFGTFNRSAGRFTAQIVHAGSNVEGVDFDTVYGHVVARNGDQLLIKGAYLMRPDTDARFRRTVQVNLSAQTRVTKIGDTTGDLGTQAISVGQRLAAFGHLSVDPAVQQDPAIVPVLEATHVRMLVTTLRGTVLSTVPGELDLSLRAIGALSPSQFDFAGTGASALLDADPGHYEVATGTLPLASLSAGEAAKVLGYVAPFGAGPPDFEGRTVIDRRDLAALLGIGWGAAGTATPFLSMEPTGLALDVANPDIGERHYLVLRFTKVDIATLGSLSLAPPDSGLALYGIWEPGHIELFNDFGAFVGALADRLGAGDRALSLSASGAFDEGSHTLAARHISVFMKSAAPQQ